MNITGSDAGAILATRGSALSISLVIVNKNDRGITSTLAALRHLAIDPTWEMETLVVDASDGRLDDVRRRFPQVRWISFPGRGDKPTIAEQRNVGVANSTGEIVVFIDASCVPDPGWLPTLLTPMLRDGELLVAGSHRSTGKRSLRDQDAHFRGVGPYVREAPTLNLAVAREVFDLIGGFDETFHYGSDVDFTWRAVDGGCRIRYVPEAVVGHDWGSTRADMRRSFRYGQARYHLYAKHPHRVTSVWRREPELVAYPLFLLTAPLALLNPWIIALLIIPLVKNARHQPLLTLTHHLVSGAGVLTAAWSRGKRSSRVMPADPGSALT
jgi:GT2 family glycosyltransferase